MKVFISWSGPQSKAIAEAIRKWIPGVLQAVKPYFSPDDVVKGSRWSSEIAKELEASRVGLLIVTPENVAAPWLMFEAGALAKNLEKSKVCPLLFGLEATDVTGPMVQFQGARFDVVEVKRVVKMINSELGDSALASEVLDPVFEMWWPRLETEIAAIRATPTGDADAPRPDRELLEEVLLLTRQLSRENRARRVDADHPAITELVLAYESLMLAVESGSMPPALVEALKALDRPLRYLSRRRLHPDHRVARDREELKSLRRAAEVLVKSEPLSSV